jgi:hypothetical protein
MKKLTLTLTAIGMLLAATGSLLAHHSYGAYYFLDQHVILKGMVAKVSFKDPHVMLTIETKNSGTWEAEWTQATGLMRRGINEDTIRAGDFLEIEASPARNPDWRVVSALREIRRPADGWRWVSDAAWPGPRVIE